MLVVKDQGLLDELMVSLQLVDVVLVVDDVVLVLLQLVHLVFQGARDLDGAPRNLLTEATRGGSTGRLASRATVCASRVPILLRRCTGARCGRGPLSFSGELGNGSPTAGQHLYF